MKSLIVQAVFQIRNKSRHFNAVLHTKKRSGIIRPVKIILHFFCEDLISRRPFTIFRNVNAQQYCCCWSNVYFTYIAFDFVTLFYTRTSCYKDWGYRGIVVTASGR